MSGDECGEIATWSGIHRLIFTSGILELGAPVLLSGLDILCAQDELGSVASSRIPSILP